MFLNCLLGSALAVSVISDSTNMPYVVSEDTLARLIYSQCSGEEIYECVDYELSCHTDGYGVRFTTHLFATELASNLIKEAGDDVLRAGLSLADGALTARVDISEVELGHNAMDGGWITTLGIENSSQLLKTITEQTSHSVKLYVGGYEFPLQPSTGSNSALLKFKEECLKVNPYLRG